jgi:hypothetical protein
MRAAVPAVLEEQQRGSRWWRHLTRLEEQGGGKMEIARECAARRRERAGPWHRADKETASSAHVGSVGTTCGQNGGTTSGAVWRGRSLTVALSPRCYGVMVVWPSLGHFKLGWATLWQWAGTLTLFHLIQRFFHLPNQFKIANYEKGTSVAPKISKHCKVEDKLKRKNFPFGKKFKFPT